MEEEEEEMEVDLGVRMDAVVESMDRRLLMLRCSATTRGMRTRRVGTFLRQAEQMMLWATGLYLFYEAVGRCTFTGHQTRAEIGTGQGKGRTCKGETPYWMCIHAGQTYTITLLHLLQ